MTTVDRFRLAVAEQHIGKRHDPEVPAAFSDAIRSGDGGEAAQMRQYCVHRQQGREAEVPTLLIKLASTEAVVFRDRAVEKSVQHYTYQKQEKEFPTDCKRCRPISRYGTFAQPKREN